MQCLARHRLILTRDLECFFLFRRPPSRRRHKPHERTHIFCSIEPPNRFDDTIDIACGEPDRREISHLALDFRIGHGLRKTAARMRHQCAEDLSARRSYAHSRCSDRKRGIDLGMHARAKLHHRLLHDQRVGIFAHARRAEQENSGHAVLDADLGIAFVGHRPVRARKQQRMPRDRDGGNVRRRERIFAAQLEAGIEHRVEHNAAGIGLIGVPGDFPAFAQGGKKRIVFELITHGMRPALRSLDGTRGGGAAGLREQRRQQPIARGVADADILAAGGEILGNSRGLAGGNVPPLPIATSGSGREVD